MTAGQELASVYSIADRLGLKWTAVQGWATRGDLTRRGTGPRREGLYDVAEATALHAHLAATLITGRAERAARRDRIDRDREQRARARAEREDATARYQHERAQQATERQRLAAQRKAAAVERSTAAAQRRRPAPPTPTVVDAGLEHMTDPAAVTAYRIAQADAATITVSCAHSPDLGLHVRLAGVALTATAAHRLAAELRYAAVAANCPPDTTGDLDADA